MWSQRVTDGRGMKRPAGSARLLSPPTGESHDDMLSTLDPSTALPDLIAPLRQDGAIILRELVSHELADAVSGELRPHFDRIGKAAQNDFNGYKTLRISSILKRSRRSAELIAHPRILEIADAILLPHCV